jgi:hypothetical protein
MTLKWLSSYAPVDEEFDNVSLLLHGDGTNGSTTIVDSSSSPKAVTAVGNAQISTAQSKFGGSSLAFDGTGDSLEVSSANVLNFGAGDFTVECWIYLANTTQTKNIIRGIENNSFYFRVGQSYLGNVNGLGVARSNVADSDRCSFTFSALQWYHIAVTRTASQIRFFVDGIQQATTNAADGSFAYNDTGTVVIGSSTNEDFNGYIDDLRITKGVARYTQNFTPPTAPFPDLSPSGRITIEDNSLDVDARQYIINVEEQDGQPLESGVRTAINDFVVGCKSDGIWNAIKASCILAGARTLDGALVPLTGGAPTNFNFVGADYDRETGLVGDGSTKYLDSNRNNNADPQDNFHLSVFRGSALVSGEAVILAGAGASGTTGRTGLNNNHASAFTNGYFFRARSASDGSSFASGSSSNAGFIGVNRASSTQISYRAPGPQSGSITVTSEPIYSANIFIFGTNNANTFQSGSTSRLAFYSIGESLDLAKLDTRVSNLMTAIGAAIP